MLWDYPFTAHTMEDLLLINLPPFLVATILYFPWESLLHQRAVVDKWTIYFTVVPINGHFTLVPINGQFTLAPINGQFTLVPINEHFYFFSG